jgi:hypothetical protein
MEALDPELLQRHVLGRGERGHGREEGGRQVAALEAHAEHGRGGRGGIGRRPRDRRDDPLDGDAGIDDPARRSRSLWISLVLSLCRRPASLRLNAAACLPKPLRSTRAASVRIVRSSRSSETPLRAARDFRRRIASSSMFRITT